ncbi:PREDICTED: 3-isopropylmalate dehydratase small subunit 3 isoform X1 [Tarenaya hassleriana]|uniref:3-isopropylmalate dehydratase small subunit 3 isoform X1 n=1 Tax=Tarenaya hassleriana TaxID=28532 RepID=UPI00053C153D|nr:PREDICTED: 3-isopropylmalate dehydratase small subunit 3 isoform X1 [Tarenaya hassleriana]
MAASLQSFNPTLARAFSPPRKLSFSPFHSPVLKLLSSSTASFQPLVSSPSSSFSISPPCVAASSAVETDATKTFHGLCYVVGDNIDTDQIIPSEYHTLVPSNPAEYEKLGSYAFIGLPASYTTRFVEPGEMKTNYSIIIGGDNFGCGSSREHAPVALGAAGTKAVVAESYARIFFRNSVATDEIYPLESEVKVCEECKTGGMVTIELKETDSVLINHTIGREYKLKPIGDAGPVIDAGDIFAYARTTGMIPSASS